MKTFEAYGALAGYTGFLPQPTPDCQVVTGWYFENGCLTLPNGEAEVASRILTRYHTVRILSEDAVMAQAQPDTPAPKPAPTLLPVPEPAPEPMPETAPEPGVVLRAQQSLEEELLRLPRNKLAALVEGCDRPFLDRLLAFEGQNLNRPRVVALLSGDIHAP